MCVYVNREAIDTNKCGVKYRLYKFNIKINV